MKSKQTGVTLLGFLVILFVGGFFAYMAMKLIPAYSEYMGVTKAMEGMASEEGNGKSLDQIRRELMKKMDFQYVDDASVRPEDISIERENNIAILHVAYDKQIPFMYNIDFLLHFDKSVQMQGQVGS